MTTRDTVLFQSKAWYIMDDIPPTPVRGKAVITKDIWVEGQLIDHLGGWGSYENIAECEMV
ncbi:hypothetical protein AGMMS49983_03800 [Clostridia bacterium]|nr:hypothetical protein AGMMS49983_03800 [Clostridia bacterium]